MFHWTTWFRDSDSKGHRARAAKTFRWIQQELHQDVIDFHRDLFEEPGVVTFLDVVGKCMNDSISPFYKLTEFEVIPYEWWDGLQPTVGAVADDIILADERSTMEIRGQLKRGYLKEMAKMTKVRSYLEAELSNNGNDAKKLRAMSLDVSSMVDQLLGVSALFIFYYLTNGIFRRMPKSAICSAWYRCRETTRLPQRSSRVATTFTRSWEYRGPVTMTKTELKRRERSTTPMVLENRGDSNPSRSNGCSPLQHSVPLTLRVAVGCYVFDLSPTLIFYVLTDTTRVCVDHFSVKFQDEPISALERHTWKQNVAPIEIEQLHAITQRAGKKHQDWGKAVKLDARGHDSARPIEIPSESEPSDDYDHNNNAQHEPKAPKKPKHDPGSLRADPTGRRRGVMEEPALARLKEVAEGLEGMGPMNDDTGDIDNTGDIDDARETQAQGNRVGRKTPHIDLLNLSSQVDSLKIQSTQEQDEDIAEDSPPPSNERNVASNLPSSTPPPDERNTTPSLSPPNVSPPPAGQPQRARPRSPAYSPVWGDTSDPIPSPIPSPPVFFQSQPKKIAKGKAARRPPPSYPLSEDDEVTGGAPGECNIICNNLCTYSRLVSKKRAHAGSVSDPKAGVVKKSKYPDPSPMPSTSRSIPPPRSQGGWAAIKRAPTSRGRVGMLEDGDEQDLESSMEDRG